MNVYAFNAHNGHELDALTLTAEADYVRRFFDRYMKQPSHQFIANVQTTMELWLVGDCLLPVSINEDNEADSYVASLYAHYIYYAQEELYLIDSNGWRRLSEALIQVIARQLKRARVNQVVYVNNWLFSTNLYPTLTEAHIAAIRAYSVARFPHHYLVFRSLNERLYGPLCRAFAAQSFRRLASRQVYISLPWSQFKKRQREHVNADYSLIRKKNYTVRPPRRDELADVKRLYNSLYIDKYSSFNPQFTDLFYETSFAEQLLTFLAVYNEQEEMIGVIGYWQLNGVMTVPILGYDIERGVETGAYRVLSALIAKEADRLGLELNQSSGAATFKRNRGAEPFVEYSMIALDHLPNGRTWPMKLLCNVLDRIGVPLLRKYDK